MASNPPSLDGSGSNGTLPRNYPINTNSPRDYDNMMQNDKTHSEMSMLRREHSVSSRRCDHANTLKELEYFRGQHRAAMNQLEVTTQDSAALRTKYSEVVNENQRLEHEVNTMRAQMAELQEQVDNGNSEMFVRGSRRGATNDDYDQLRKRCDELLASHSSALTKLEITQEEKSRCNKQCEELSQERNSLKQQRTKVYSQWDKAVRECNKYREALAKTQEQYEEAVKEVNQHMAFRMKASKDLKRLTDERNAAMQEYTLIMSERDTVHKEMEKLSDDLNQEYNKNKLLEADSKEMLEEKQALNYQMETLRREIASALHDRDKALKECNDLREKFGEYNASKDDSRDLMKNRLDNVICPGENSARKEVSGNGDSRSLAQRQRLDNLDQANQELESLRKSLDKAQSELSEAIQEAEVSKGRRDWAFSERDKIVLERESIRTLCDKLRKERDRAVSELAEALRESDSIKKQRNEACKELKLLKETLESHLEKEAAQAQMNQFRGMGHNHSHDSAIDSDMQEWETEILDIDLSGLPSDGDLGFELVGGRDDPHYPNDSGIYVASVTKGSIADGKLRVNDCISRVNNVDCTSVSKRMVVETVRSSLPLAHVVVRRRRAPQWAGSRGSSTAPNAPNSNSNSSTASRSPPQIPPPPGNRNTQWVYNARLAATRNHGLSLDAGIFIGKIIQGSLAAKEGGLAVGDRVLSINNKSMDGKSAHEATSILNDDRVDLTSIVTLKSSTYNSEHPESLVNVFTPAHHYKKVSNSTQTEDHHHLHMQHHQALMSSMMGGGGGNGQTQKMQQQQQLQQQQQYHDSDFVTSARPYLTPPPLPAGAVYTVSKSGGGGGGGGGQEKNIPGGAWFREKFDLVRGRRHSKERNRSSDEKKKYRNSSPNALTLSNTFEQEEAIAVLDDVIESADSFATAGGTATTKRPKRRGKEMSVQEKNGGTWPKARSNVLQTVTGTIINPRKKERAPLSSILLDNERTLHDNHCCQQSQNNRKSTPIQIPMSLQSVLNRHSVYKSVDNSAHFVNDVKKCVSDFDRSSDQSNRISDNSLDYSMNKQALEKDLEFYMKKNSRDSHLERETVMITNAMTAPNHARIHSHFLVPGPRFSHFPIHPHPHSHAPLMLPSSPSGESFIFEPPYSMTSFSHPHPSSADAVYHQPKRPNVVSGHHHSPYRTISTFREDLCPYMEGGGTFPRKKENQRFRIPSNPSVTSKSSAGKVSTGSIERSSERGSPMPPTFHVEVLSPGSNASKHSSMHDYCWPQKPSPGELRRVHIDKSAEPLGIQISCLDSGGIFVSTVSDNSLASQVGLQIGDQLLEVCGINMRSATYQLAASVLRQCGNSITMLVQYSPDKYHELEGSASCSSSQEDDGDGEPTPCNSPKGVRKSHPLSLLPHSLNGGQSTLTRNAGANALQRQTSNTRNNISSSNNNNNSSSNDEGGGGNGSSVSSKSHQQQVSSHQQQQQQQNHQQSHQQSQHEPRYLQIETHKCPNLGISLVGGNAVGIFIHSVQPDSLAGNAGLRTGDQILEYNGSDLRSATAEEAAYELAKPADKVVVLAHYNLDRYNEIKDKPGDSLYVRCGFDRSGTELSDSLQLCFNKDDVLYVDNTMFNGVPGHWRAWKLDGEGRRTQCGIIPSKVQVEEEMLLRRSSGDLEGRGSTSARRSFFRRKKHQRSGSRDSKELASFSNISVGWYSDSGTLHEDVSLCSYQRVERLDYPEYRPVLVLGPLAEFVVDKLVSEFPDLFRRCMNETRHCSQAALDQELAENMIIDYRRKGSYFECTTVASITSICNQNLHCMLDISVSSVEKLHRHQIYPIVLLIKFKSTKQIKEVKDTRYLLDKVSAKAAKEMYEHGQKLEVEYRHRISVVIPAGGNIAYMCTQVKAAIDAEQKKSLWVPC